MIAARDAVKLLAILGGAFLATCAWAAPQQPSPALFSLRNGTGTIYSKTPDGLWTATVEDDKLYLIDRRTKRKVGEPLRTRLPPQRWSFSSDGRYLVIGEGFQRREENRGCIEVWDMTAQRMVTETEIHRDSAGRGFGSVTHVSFGRSNAEILYTAEPQRFDGK